MCRNDYGGLIEQWKVDLIGFRARWLGFRDDEVPDLEQEIVPQLLKAEFDPNGSATENTFVERIINKQLYKMLRDRRRIIRKGNYETVSLDEVTERTYFGMSETARADLRHDLRAAMAGLSPPEKAVCEALMRGDSQADIRHATGKAKATISETVARLRRKFREWGLDLYREDI